MDLKSLAREPRGLTCDQKKASDAAFRGLPCDSTWSAAAHAVYDGLVTALQGRTSIHEPAPSKVCYTLHYDLQLNRGTAHEPAYPQPVTLPAGAKGSVGWHVTTGTPEEIKAQLLVSLEALYDRYDDAGPHVP